MAGRGFHSKAVANSRQFLGVGFAGHVAQDRIMIHIPDLSKEQDSIKRRMLLAGENFVSYHGVPLIAKEQVVGVLEVFHRSGTERNPEWLDFLNALAAQGCNCDR